MPAGAKKVMLGEREEEEEVRDKTSKSRIEDWIGIRAAEDARCEH